MGATMLLRLAVLALAGMLTACDNDSPTAPDAPAPTVTTPFAGTVTQNGAVTHSFPTSAAGVVTATLLTAGGEGQVVGFALGNVFGDACSIVLANDRATAGAVLRGNLTGGATTLCVRIYDVGTIAGGPVPYTVEVVHP